MLQRLAEVARLLAPFVRGKMEGFVQTVRQADDAGTERDLLSAQAAGKAGAVEPFMVVPDEGGQPTADPGLFEEVRAQVRVPPGSGVFQRIGLPPPHLQIQDVVGEPQEAHVMHESGVKCVLRLARGKAESSGDDPGIDTRRL